MADGDRHLVGRLGSQNHLVAVAESLANGQFCWRDRYANRIVIGQIHGKRGAVPVADGAGDEPYFLGALDDIVIDDAQLRFT